MIRKLLRYAKRQLIGVYLSINKVAFAAPPSFVGRWPTFTGSGRVELGKNCSFRSFRIPLVFDVRGGAILEVGDNTRFNDGVNICANKRVVIGPFSRIGDRVTIYDTNFHRLEPGADVLNAEVQLGRNVWICAGCTILPGVRIGDHSVIGANSVVTKDIPSRSIAAGAPAKVMRNFECPDDWIR